ncbi:hypothetical protein AWM68_13325 [Fictibacillus phosphorivorans]|uniref:Asparagine synthetase domain-containing protein n=1 Tax=Fictibacillus phosphorivorans TaxID=1221500 RepID=A0A161TH88_9BACL|nr:hypothetical protein [Fictibacillus phosphorivorans]KZE64082.1 hypothetical protein AWM68_13325 [Fictibacillus phosphorivorans]
MMQLFLAYKFFKEVSADELNERKDRVENYYFSSLENERLQYNHSACSNIGLFFWQPENKKYKFPAWQEDNEYVSCFTYAPKGWEQTLHSPVDINEAPLLFTRRIKQDPSLMSLLTPPLIFCYLDKTNSSIKIYNDSLGMGKLYELQTDEGVVYSNKLAALYLFMNKKAEMDTYAWQIFSSAGWLMGDTSPIKGSVRVKPSMEITLNNEMNVPKVLKQIGGLSLWVSPRKLDRHSFEEGITNILESTRSFFRMFDFPVNSLLSGGKDSRVSSAILIKSGVHSTFTTFGPIQGEIETAQKLMNLVGLDDRHIVNDRKSEKASENPVDLKERLNLLHFAYDGDYPPVRQSGRVSVNQLYNIISASCVGAGGEIATANYYGNDSIYQSIIKKGDDGPRWRLSRYLTSSAGNEEIAESVNKEVWALFEEAKQLGIQGLNAMDYFYLKERLRRWAPISGAMNNFTPFATPGFIRLAFDQTPDEKRNYKLHRNILETLIPQWSEVPFYKDNIIKTGIDEKAANNMRIWQNEDKEYVNDIINNRDIWKSFFNEMEIRDLWGRAISGESLYPRYEATFQRIAWICSYEDHLKNLNNKISINDYINS